MGLEVRRKIDQGLVWEVCDELLADGARPTIERVRERVGGSPNTVSIHLETWFKSLSARMGALREGVAAPAAGSGLPEGVIKLAQQMWEGARAAAKLEADRDVQLARQEAEERVARAEEARRRAEAALAERGERVLALEADLARGTEERKGLEREHQRLSRELGSATGRLEEVERAMLSTQGDLRDARQAIVQRGQEAEEALKAQADQHHSDRKGLLLEIDRARSEAAKAAKREEQLADKLKNLQQDYTLSRESGALLEVRLEQAQNECARIGAELAAVRERASAAEESARERESVFLSRLDEASKTTAAMATEVRQAHAAIERLRAEVAGRLDAQVHKSAKSG